MRIKLPPILSASLISVAAGFAAGSARSYSGAFASGDGRSAPDFTGNGGEASPADSGKNPSAVGKPASRAALAARFGVLLRQFNIDPSWAEDLAAGDTSGFSDLLERIKPMPAGQKQRLREFLLGRWAELDPAGGVAFFKSRRDDEGLADLFRQWQRIDFPAAAAKAGEEGDEILRRTLQDKALLDPAGLLAWLEDRPDLNPLSIFSSGGGENIKALISMAEKDPDKMLAWTRQLPENQWDTDFIKGLAAQLAKRSPDDALAWAKSIRDSVKSAAALTGAAKALIVSYPERALAVLAALPDAESLDNRNNQYEVLGKLNIKDAGRAMELAQLLPDGEMRKHLMRKTLGNLLESSPSDAFALSEALGPRLGMQSMFNLPESVKTPESARRILEAAGEAKDSVYREAIAKEALVDWLEKEPGSLAAYLKEKGDTPLLRAMRENLQAALAVQQLRDGKADPELAAIVGLPPELVVKNQAIGDPSQAARDLETIDDPEARRGVAAEVARAYVQQDRNEAMAWAETVKDPEVQATAWKTIAADWVGEDSWQASQWIAKLPEGKGRDSAVLAMADGISKTDPDLAWQWALSMSDPCLKNQALATAAQAWASKDASALQQALSDGTLTPLEHQAVLEKLSGNVK